MTMNQIQNRSMKPRRESYMYLLNRELGISVFSCKMMIAKDHIVLHLDWQGIVNE